MANFVKHALFDKHTQWERFLPSASTYTCHSLMLRATVSVRIDRSLSARPLTPFVV